MGRMQREKGKRFERQIAAMFRERWPDAVVRRASQADRAHESDVFIEGGPPMLKRLWIECQDARNPTPLAKLEQAEGDVGHAHNPNWTNTLPVVIWHRLGAREINVTTRAWVFDSVRSNLHRVSDAVVTLSLGDFLDVLSETTARKEAA